MLKTAESINKSLTCEELKIILKYNDQQTLGFRKANNCMVMVVVLHWYQELPAPQLCSFSQNELSQNYDLCHWQHCR